MLEEYITVLMRTTSCRMLRIQCVCTELLNSVHWTHFLQILIVPLLDLLNLMRSTETIEEVDERNLALE